MTKQTAYRKAKKTLDSNDLHPLLLGKLDPLLISNLNGGLRASHLVQQTHVKFRNNHLSERHIAILIFESDLQRTRFPCMTIRNVLPRTETTKMSIGRLKSGDKCIPGLVTTPQTVRQFFCPENLTLKLSFST